MTLVPGLFNLIETFAEILHRGSEEIFRRLAELRAMVVACRCVSEPVFLADRFSPSYRGRRVLCEHSPTGHRMRAASNETLGSNAVFLERLFSKYGRPLRQFFRRRLSSEEEASDAAQEVFLRLARPGAQEAAEGRERAYLFTTARNLLVDRHRRREARGMEEALPLIEADAVAAPDDTEQLVIVRETVATLREGLSSLKSRDREVFVLHRFGNLGYRQIAVQLGISERTVERRMSRALSHLQLSLKRTAERKAPPLENT